MHNFKNEKIQELYDYLVEDCSENDINYSLEYVAQKIESHLKLFKKYDLIHFEESIDEWDSSILEKLARVLSLINSISVNTDIIETIYLLAFINCNYEDASDLLDNLFFEISDFSVLSKNLLEKTLKRINEFIEGYTFFKNKYQLERAENALALINKKLNLLE